MAGLPTVSRPTVPSPFDMERMDISDRFRPMQDYTDPSSYTSASSRDDDPSGPGAYTGSLNVTGLGGNVAERFVGMPQGLGTAIGPTGLGPFVALGTALSSRNLTSIQNKQRQGEAGYAVGMLNGRIIGVSPGAFGGYSLSGVLPEGLTVQQRNEIAEQLLAMSGPRFQPDEGVGGSSGDIPDPNTGLTIAEIEAGAGNFRPGIDTPFTPTPTPGGTTVVTGHPGVDQGPTYIPPDTSIIYTPDPGEDSSPPGNQYSLPSGPAPGYTPPPDPGYYGDPGDDSDDTSPATGGADSPSYDGPPSSGGGGGFQDTGGFGPGGFRAKGGTVQRTGFVEGSPDNYAKGDTVADTVKTQVREGSFVINAPTVERLQQAGMLPKGVDNSDKNATIKANKGGLMDVALSKGEYVIEPEEAQRIGYSFLEKINDQGKAEVDRRQSMNQGGFAGTDLSGIPPLAAGLRPPVSTDTKPEGFVATSPAMPDAPIPRDVINGIDIDNVGRAISLVETRGYTDRNDGYFYTRSDTRNNPSSAFGPLQITGDTLAAMLKESDELRIQMNEDINPGFSAYLDKFAADARNRTNYRRTGKLYTGERGKKAVGRKATPQEAEMYKNLGPGSISLEDHKKFYPLLGKLYLRYKAGMSSSEEDMVRRHFGNDKSTQKYRDAKTELGIN